MKDGTSPHFVEVMVISGMLILILQVFNTALRALLCPDKANDKHLPNEGCGSADSWPPLYLDRAIMLSALPEASSPGLNYMKE
ncbi:hypothetical protein VI817_007201 [Penicillium citrinum]|nr:hypothetical protein VI817_007201 [Penicillium citrinum]